jgi:hypothetical protein
MVSFTPRHFTPFRSVAPWINCKKHNPYLKAKLGRTPACVKTCNSQDMMSATWRKERSTVETNEIVKTAAHRFESWCWRKLHAADTCNKSRHVPFCASRLRHQYSRNSTSVRYRMSVNRSLRFQGTPAVLRGPLPITPPMTCSSTWPPLFPSPLPLPDEKRKSICLFLWVNVVRSRRVVSPEIFVWDCNKWNLLCFGWHSVGLRRRALAWLGEEE